MEPLLGKMADEVALRPRSWVTSGPAGRGGFGDGATARQNDQPSGLGKSMTSAECAPRRIRPRHSRAKERAEVATERWSQAGSPTPSHALDSPDGHNAVGL